MSVGLSDEFEDDIVEAMLNTLIPIDDDTPDPDGDGGVPVPVVKTAGSFYLLSINIAFLCAL